MAYILAADIGGTNSRFACFSIKGGAPVMEKSIWLKTHEATSFPHLLEMLWESDFGFTHDMFSAVSIAVPGAVQHGVVSGCLPNAPWGVDLRNIDYGWKRACLINDFAAQAFACRTGIVDDAMVIQEGVPLEDGVIGVIGAGTGLGYSALVPCGKGWTALPSEGGHMAFPFTGMKEAEYGEFNRRESGRNWAEGDTVVTGLGLRLIHKYLTGEELTAEEISSQIIPESETTRWYARFYGRACRNWAIAMMAYGGMFIAGGVAAKNPMLVTAPEFLEEFHNSHFYEEFLRSVPIRLNANEESGLYGAAFHGVQLLNH
ncbi:glucokinase [uncultured Pseudodesulfovibrio sp.]|uniref:glucokinase n=1 Tax=uncultured Pseudodesulfovibrio sp. TaxID=2035858 RepID=UPI0029C66657|nr:glucokinase [uncultured Pseudodesulfovibrio sp.]